MSNSLPASRDPFADDVLGRLIASNQDYRSSHGHYIVPLAQRLLDARAALERIASVDCQIACRSLPFATRCQGCIAREALGRPL